MFKIKVNPVDTHRVQCMGQYDFDSQLNITHSTDLLIGMHGAGLQSFHTCE